MVAHVGLSLCSRPALPALSLSNGSNVEWVCSVVKVSGTPHPTRPLIVYHIRRAWRVTSHDVGEGERGAAAGGGYGEVGMPVKGEE